MANQTYNDKSLTQLLQEIKNELLEFATTRYEMLVAEIKEKVRIWKLSLPMIGTAVVLGITAFMTLTFSLVALIAAAIDSKFAWFFAAIAITILYTIVASIFGYLGYREITSEGMAPTRTLEVLKQDQQWIKDETRAA